MGRITARIGSGRWPLTIGPAIVAIGFKALPASTRTPLLTSVFPAPAIAIGMASVAAPFSLNCKRCSPRSTRDAHRHRIDSTAQ